MKYRLIALTLCVALLLSSCNTETPAGTSTKVEEVTTTTTSDVTTSADSTTFSTTPATTTSPTTTTAAEKEPSNGRKYYIDHEITHIDDDYFRIFEEAFYGTWTWIDGSKETFTYSKSPFTFENAFYPHGIVETDDYYAITYVAGGVGGCYFIEKSAPDVMYNKELWYETNSRAYIIINEDYNAVYTGRANYNTPSMTEHGEISVFGMEWLEYSYGWNFAARLDHIYQTHSEDYITDNEGRHWIHAGALTLPLEKRYLIERGEDRVVFTMLYRDAEEYRKYMQGDESTEPTERQLALTLEKDESGSWELTSVTPASQESDFGYVEMNGNSVHIFAYLGMDKDVVIPEYIGEYPVTSVSLPLIAENSDIEIETVTLPKTVKAVQCPDYPEDRTEKSYYVDDENEYFTSADGVIYSKDKSVLVKYPIGREGGFTVPETVTEIGGGAFYECVELTAVNIGSNVKTIGVQAFAFSSVSELNIAEGLESIGWEAFRRTKIKSIVLPKTLKTIECRAFEGSALRSVTLPTAIDEFGADVFTMTELGEINLVDNGEGLYMWNDILCKGNELIRMIKGSKVEKLVFDRTMTSLDCVFENCTNLKVIEILDGCDFIITMTEFGDFEGCSSIKRVYIPGSVVSCPFYYYYQEMSHDLVVYTPKNGENSYDGRWSGEKCRFVYVDSYEDYLKRVGVTG